MFTNLANIQNRFKKKKKKKNPVCLIFSHFLANHLFSTFWYVDFTVLPTVIEITVETPDDSQVTLKVRNLLLCANVPGMRTVGKEGLWNKCRIRVG